MKNTNNLNEIAVSKKDYTLSDGRILPIGVNFRSLLLMTSYEGGFEKLKEDMENKEVLKKLKACEYIFYCLIRASGEEVTVEEASMMIGIDDFDTLFEVFQDYSAAVEKIQKKTELKQKKLKKSNGRI